MSNILFWIVGLNPNVNDPEYIGAKKKIVAIREIKVSAIDAKTVQRGNIFGLNQFKEIADKSKSPAGM